MSRWVIPDHWEWTTIETIADIVAGGTPNASDETNFCNDGTPWITPADLTEYDQPTIQRGRRGLSVKGMEGSSAKLLPAGAVLFSSRAPIGYCVVAANPIATNQGFKNLILRGEIDPHYVRLYLIASKEYAESQASGTTFPELSAARMKLLAFPLPPLAEQRRIVAKIEVLTARSRAARAALAEVPTLLEQFRQSVLASAFRGDLTAEWRVKNPTAEPASVLLDRIRAERRKQWETKYPKKKYVAPEPVDDSDLPELPEGWCWAAAEEIVDPETSIVYGIVQPGPPLDEGVPYVRGLDIQDGKILTEQLWKTSPDIAESYRKSKLRGGDILLGIIRHTKVAVVPESLAGGNIGRATALIRPATGITSWFLAYYLESPIGHGWLLANQRGSDMPVLNLKELWRLPVVIAPLAEQTEIVSQLELWSNRYSGVRSEVEAIQEQAGILDQSILAKAFRGELMPQDPADEPAAVLLERLRAAQTEASTNGSPRRKARK